MKPEPALLSTPDQRRFSEKPLPGRLRRRLSVGLVRLFLFFLLLIRGLALMTRLILLLLAAVGLIPLLMLLLLVFLFFLLLIVHDYKTSTG
jgi:hypothetical protein